MDNNKQTKAKSKEQQETNTKTLPIIIMLAAGCISCFVSVFQQTTLTVFLTRLAVSLAVFYVIGCIARVCIDRALMVPKSEEDEEALQEQQEREEQENSSDEDEGSAEVEEESSDE